MEEAYNCFGQTFAEIECGVLFAEGKWGSFLVSGSGFPPHTGLEKTSQPGMPYYLPQLPRNENIPPRVFVGQIELGLYA